MSVRRGVSLFVLSSLVACAGTSSSSPRTGPGAAVESIHDPPNAPPVPEDAPEGPPPVTVEAASEAAPAQGIPSDASSGGATPE